MSGYLLNRLAKRHTYAYGPRIHEGIVCCAAVLQHGGCESARVVHVRGRVHDAGFAEGDDHLASEDSRASAEGSTTDVPAHVRG